MVYKLITPPNILSKIPYRSLDPKNAWKRPLFVPISNIFPCLNLPILISIYRMKIDKKQIWNTTPKARPKSRIHTSPREPQTKKTAVRQTTVKLTAAVKKRGVAINGYSQWSLPESGEKTGARFVWRWKHISEEK